MGFASGAVAFVLVSSFRVSNNANSLLQIVTKRRRRKPI